MLHFSSGDPRRGKILFTESRTNLVLEGAPRRDSGSLRKSVLHDTPVSSTTDRVADLVSAAMYAGAMAELAQEWLLGTPAKTWRPSCRRRSSC